jgi:hypothetical protein
MLTSTKVHYEHNEKLEEKHFEPTFGNGEQCEVRFKNSQFLIIPLIKLAAAELENSGLHIEPVGMLTPMGLAFIEEKKSQDEAVTWPEYCRKYHHFDQAP